jgi:hypothetical protein
MSFDLKGYATNTLKTVGDFYVRDLEALTHEQLDENVGGTGRTAYDYTFEVAWVNNAMAKRMKDEMPEPPPWTFGENWAVAPESFRNKETAARELSQSIQNVIDALGDDIERPVEAMGSTKTAFERAMFCALHTNYHCAQLNLLQSMAGDLQIHWM